VVFKGDRVRSLVYEVELKYGQQSDAVHGIIELIEKGRYEIVGTKVRFAVCIAHC